MLNLDTILSPYPLPAAVTTPLLALAARSDALIIGELHGTQEVPRVVATLLEPLVQAGYRALALELPSDETAALAAWARGNGPPPLAFTRPSGDGRATVQLLALIRQVVQRYDLTLLGIDQRQAWTARSWAARDRAMALTLLAGWATRCPRGRVLAICGSLHARLAPGRDAPRLWPSCAAQLCALLPTRRISSLAIQFRAGAYRNLGVKRLRRRWMWPAVPQLRTEVSGFSAALILPQATPATLLVPSIAV